MLDILVIIVLLLFGIIGYNRGLIDTVFTLFSTAVSLVLAFIVYPVVNFILKLTPIYTEINKWVSEKVATIDFGMGVQTQSKAISSNITWLPEFISEQLVENNNTEMYKLLGVQNIVDYVSVSLTHIIISMLALLITWVILKFVFTGVLRGMGKLIAKLPVISGLNKLGGLGVGFAKGLLTLWIIGLLIPLVMTIPAYEGIGAYIEASYLTKWLYENNLVIVAFNHFIGNGI